MRNFASPHVHIQSLDTASTPEAFIKREQELGTGVVTCTDHGTLAVTRKVYDLARKAKLTPILGLEAYFRDDNCPILTAAGIPKTVDEDYQDKGESFIEYNKYYHITTHYRDAEAFETASRLLSRADKNSERHGSEYKPIFNWNDLEELGGTNTVFTSGCLIGVVQRHLLRDRPDLARKYYERVRSIVRPGNFFVEVFPHRCHKNWVQAVFLHGPKAGDAAPEKLRFHPKKTLRVVTSKGDVHEGKARDLIKKFGEQAEPVKLVAVSHYRKWEEREPFTIARWESVEDYVQNECKPWAPDGDSQIGGNRFMLDLAREFGDPVLVSDDAHFAHADEKIVQDVRLGQSGSWRFFGSYHRQSSEEAFAYFREFMGVQQAEFEGWVENSQAWAGLFKDFKFQDRKSLPTKFYPPDTLGHTMTLVKKHGRMDWSDQKYVARLRSEINLLYKNGTIDLLPYFMIDEEVCNLYERNGLLTGPGRGSAAGLLLTYLLGITHVDPLRYDLSQDRFLTVDRIRSGKLPDIDQDLPSRDLLVGADGASGWLRERFGDHYAQISTDTSMKLKSAVKDVCRVMRGDVSREIHQLCSRLPDPPQGISDRDFVFGYEANEERVPGILESDANLQDFVKRYPAEWDVVVKCLGLVRQKSRHACAYVIANEPVANFIPTQSIGGIECTSYTAGSVEAAGGLKMDFLVVNALNDLAATIKLIQERHGQGRGHEATDEYFGHDFKLNGKRVPGLRVIPHRDGRLYDIWDLPEDQDVFRAICEQKTETVFQFNTPGAQKWLKHFDYEKEEKPGHKALDSIESLSAFTALDRPGPLDAYVGQGSTAHNMLVEYSLRARGETATGNMPVLDTMLSETHGVIVYQEQLQRVFQQIAETDGIVANSFREHVSKKKMAEVIKDREVFLPKATEKLGTAVAEQLWGQLFTFGQYGFNRSHSTCYVIIGYACAWLKHHYPLEWWCSVLRNAERKEINEKFWIHCGHLVDLPDIKHSGDQFDIQGARIRAPLSLLQGIGPAAHLEICEERPFKDIDDFCVRIEARKLRLGQPCINRTVKKKRDKKTGEVTEIITESPGVKKARSAITKGTMATLIISGAADGLFPEGSTMLEKLALYEAARAKALGKKKPDPVPEKYLNVNQFARYQMRKKMLPGWSQSLLHMFRDMRAPGVSQDGEGRWLYQDKFPFVTAKAIEYLNAMTILPKKQTVAVAAYITADRRFSYQDNTKTAADLLLDIAGTQVKFVQWPSREGKLPGVFGDGNLAGALVVAAITKWQVGRDPTIDSLVVVAPPLTDKPEEESAG